MTTNKQDASRFKIGAVARLTGIPVETLRAWERRYQVVTPQRAVGGSRLYGNQDVARLAAIKRLVDGGNSISTIAQLSLEQLKGRESAADALQVSHIPEGPARIAVIGSSLPLRLSEALDSVTARRVAIVASYANAEEFARAGANDSLDGVIIEEPVLIRESVNRLRRLLQQVADARVVAVYGYGKRESIRQLERLGIEALQHPITWPTLMRSLQNGRGLPVTRSAGDAYPDLMAFPVPERRFDDRQLARIASVNTNIDCECPHHIANLVVSLNHFELYSAECENLSDEDAALHAYLQRATARARSLLESALQRVIETDGIDLEEDTGLQQSSDP